MSFLTFIFQLKLCFQETPPYENMIREYLFKLNTSELILNRINYLCIFHRFMVHGRVARNFVKESCLILSRAVRVLHFSLLQGVCFFVPCFPAFLDPRMQGNKGQKSKAQVCLGFTQDQWVHQGLSLSLLSEHLIWLLKKVKN